MRFLSTPLIAQANHQAQHLHMLPVLAQLPYVPASVRHLHTGYQRLAQESLDVMGPLLDRGLGRGPVVSGDVAATGLGPMGQSARATTAASAAPSAPGAAPKLPDVASQAHTSQQPQGPATQTPQPTGAHPALAPGASLITTLDHAACAGLVAGLVAGPWVGLAFGARRVAPVMAMCVAVSCGCALGIYLVPAGLIGQGLQGVAGLLALQTRLLVQGTAWLTMARGLQSRDN